MTQIERGANVHQSKGHLRSTVPLQPLVAHPSPQKDPSSQWFLKRLTLVAVAALSTAIGITVALVLPLPTGSALNQKGAQPSDKNLWQSGFQYQVGRPVNILVMGIDRVPGAKSGSKELFNGRSDTMLMLRVDPTDDSVKLLSVPRDTQVDIPNVGVTKINDANVRGGAELAAKTVSGVLNGITIDRYVRVDTEAFRELVDQLGGVEVYVPEAMSYVDKTQKLTINLAAGLQTLNGNQAEQFARFRHDAYGDIGRVQRQQTLLKALLKRVTNPAVIPRLPGLVSAMQKYIDTNLSVEEMLALTGAGRQLSQGNFKMVMLPGRFSTPTEFNASYWIMNPEGRDRVMKQYFNIDPTTATSDQIRSANDLKIAIQNASSKTDAADQLRRYLVKRGFSNVYVASDWSEKQSQTQIIAQQGDLTNAETLKGLLGIGRVEADSTGDLESDLTIRLGDDWTTPAN
ncbi:LCP family protein [Stenomitos frigidus]|uniref:LytR family transcriptional regulator n=1 Tax=Stenomitos frigidus ULC18 TaxID=2107698 RepID=A0A2T1EI47_9CYAN|nr:LCP family protein [Stenomitos frigidus]PSB32426.1 LytR family transcriptional regulator [Stenomitos frigidus ULC18]